MPLRRISALLHDIQPNSVYRGSANPSLSRGDLSGWWSRRITGDHRFVYRVRGSGEGPAGRDRRLLGTTIRPDANAGQLDINAQTTGGDDPLLKIAIVDNLRN